MTDTHSDVEAFPLLKHLRYDLSTHTSPHILSKMRQSDAVTCQHLPTGTNEQLRAFNLLFYIEVGNTFNALYLLLNLITQGVHEIKVITKQLDSYVGTSTTQHGINTVADWLTNLDVGSHQCVQLLTHFGYYFTSGTIL